MAYKVGPLFFARGTAVLEMAYHIVQTWPPHACGTAMEVSFLGEMIRFRIPESKEEQPPQGTNASCNRSHCRCDYFTIEKDDKASQAYREYVDIPGLPRGPSAAIAPEEGLGAGLFQNIALYRTFQPVLPLLWPLWEKMVVGEPIMIIAENAAIASNVALGLVSLIAPLHYAGDFRPYFSTYDEDYSRILNCHDSSQGNAIPATILGVTNPIFAKVFKYWPTVLQIPHKKAPPPPPNRRLSGDGATAVGAATNGTGTAITSPSTPPLPPPPPPLLPQNVRPRRRFPPMKVVSSTAELEPNLGGEQPAGLLTRKEVTMRYVIQVLTRLNRQPSSKASKGDSSTSASGTCPSRRLSGSEIRTLNDQILRRHFQDLTHSFLLPFEKYFELRLGKEETTRTAGESVGGLLGGLMMSSKPKKMASIRIGLYDDPEKYLM